MIGLAAQNRGERRDEQTRCQGVGHENKADNRYAVARDGRLYRQSAIGKAYAGPCIYAGQTCLTAPAHPIGRWGWHSATVDVNQRRPPQIFQLGDSQPRAAHRAKDVVAEPYGRGSDKRPFAIAYGDFHAP